MAGARRPGPQPAAPVRLVASQHHCVVLQRRGREALAAGDTERALTLYAEAAKGGSRSADLYSDLGVLLAMKGQELAAMVQFETALGLEPQHRNARANLVKALESVSLQALRERRWADAVAGYARLCALDPRCGTFHNNCGAALCELKQPARALSYLERACALEGDNASAHYNLAVACMDLHDPRCETELLRAIELSPEYWEAHVNLGLVYYRMGRFDAAEDRLDHVLAHRPGQVEAIVHRAAMLRELGRLPECLAETRRAVALLPESSGTASDYLLARQSDPAASGPDLLADARAWAARFADRSAPDLAPAPPTPGERTSILSVAPPSSPAALAFADRDRDPERRLRIGYVSPDFHNHSVARFIEPLLVAHDRTQVEVTAYAQGLVDETTLRLRDRVDLWRDVGALDDAALARRIRDDRIDVLVDLAGHTGGNRLLVFARRAAPVQVTYCGYPGTTGLATMDWRLSDAIADPEGEGTSHGTESVWRLPHGFLCFGVEGVASSVAPSPPPSQLSGPARGAVTFGSFNNLGKIGPEVLQLWARLLAAVPGARLFMKSRALGDDRPQERLRRLFATQGIDPQRLEFLGYTTSTAAHLALYANVDIALDPFPYNGTTTTCEALWMGVPVVALRGQRHAGRVSASLLSGIGLSELVAEDESTYLETAARLAADEERLRDLRDGLRARMLASPLMSPTTIARDVEAAYRHFWRTWTDTKSQS